MLNGGFNVTLDDTGRISLPRRLRDNLNQEKVVVTMGVNPCLWLYSVERWGSLEETIISTTNQFSARDLTFRRRILGLSQELEIDKQGRILIPLTLRELAGMTKDCILLSQYDYYEIWADDRYKTYLQDSEVDFMAAYEEFGRNIKERNLGNDRNSPYAGSIGTDTSVSGTEE
jgi:MraZ protein